MHNNNALTEVQNQMLLYITSGNSDMHSKWETNEANDIIIDLDTLIEGHWTIFNSDFHHDDTLLDNNI